MSSFPKLRSYIAGLLPEDDIDRFKVSGLLLSEAPGQASGEAYVKAVAHVQSFIEPLAAALHDGDLWKIEQAEDRFLKALDDLAAICAITPGGRVH